MEKREGPSPRKAHLLCKHSIPPLVPLPTLPCPPLPHTRPHRMYDILFAAKAGVEIPLSLLVTGAVRGNVLKAIPGLLVPSECLGYRDCVSVAHGAVAAQRHRGEQSRVNMGILMYVSKGLNKPPHNRTASWILVSCTPCKTTFFSDTRRRPCSTNPRHWGLRCFLR